MNSKTIDAIECDAMRIVFKRDFAISFFDKSPPVQRCVKYSEISFSDNTSFRFRLGFFLGQDCTSSRERILVRVVNRDS